MHRGAPLSERAAAFGIRQPALDDALAGFCRAARPWAFILFREACVSRAQVSKLCAALREAAGHDALIWIDQEGGRVARLKPPEWPIWPAPARYGALHAQDAQKGLEAARLGHRLIAHELKAIGVNGDFAPALDLPAPGSDPIVGDRAFAVDPDSIAALAQAALDGLHDGGVAGCIKHMPGHGRAEADSHVALPVVKAARAALAADLAPFRALKGAEAAMTAHIVFTALDPAAPATQSKTVISEAIRGEIGFGGLLMSDDLDMKALAGPLQTKAEKAFAAGCDLVLQCSGVVSDMEAVAAGCPALAGEAARRAAAVSAIAKAAPASFDAAEGWWRFRALMGPGFGPASR